MGLSASQARFLQLTARRSNIEYEAQQINFQRIQWSNKLTDATNKYENAMTNRQLVFSLNTGSEVKDIALSYNNYKNYMNQQLEGLSTTQDKYYLVSPNGKLVVASDKEKQEMLNKFTTQIPVSQIQQAKKDVEDAQLNGTDVSDYTLKLSKINLDKAETIIEENDQGEKTEYYVKREVNPEDIIVMDNLEDVENFQQSIKDGYLYFAVERKNPDTKEIEFQTQSWETLGAGAITDALDKTDDAQAEAEYKKMQDKVQNIDKKLELRLDQLDTERDAIQTEMESISKVIDDNIEKTFKTFG